MPHQRQIIRDAVVKALAISGFCLSAGHGELENTFICFKKLSDRKL